MKISLNWLKEYINLDGFTPEQISEMLTDLGLEVEGQETFESVRGGLKGIVVGEVKSREKHENADKLSVTTVDVGAADLLHIVCGAPNVAAGQKVLVATVGTTIYPTGAEDGIKMSERKVRGELSQGMICAEDELGLGESHDGIMVLPETAKVGTPAADFLNVESDIVYEIGLTPNRSDGTNHIGTAEDLAATLKVNFGKEGKVNKPSVADFKIASTDESVDVVVENVEACPRYSGVVIKNLKVAPSPDWLKNRLEAAGVRSINNVVDVTNFVLKEMGQPLHAFDLDKVTGNKIIVKTLPKGTDFKALDEATYKLREQDLMICDGDSKPMCIGGVFGGIDSGVTDSTTSIFLEAAHFNPLFIRRSKTKHNMHTDAAFVFEKGSDPNLTVFALKRAALLLGELAGGTVASEIVDLYPNPIPRKEIEVSYRNINRLIGVEIEPKKVRDILEAMGMEYVGESEKNFTVAVPTNKSDVLRDVDIIEEIIRVYGLNNVPMPTQIRSSVVIGEKPDPNVVQNLIADMLTANGFNEMMGLSLIESRYMTDVLQIPEDKLVFINNTSNVTLDIMRPVMIFNGLEAIVRNQNRQNSDLKLYEFGKTYLKKAPVPNSLREEDSVPNSLRENQFKETQHLTIYVTGQKTAENWRKDGGETDFYTLKAHVENVLGRLGLAKYQISEAEGDEFSYGLKYHRGQQVLVNFGKVSGKICKKMGIKNSVFYADFDWDAVLKASKKSKIRFAELNKFPTMRRDLALVVDTKVKFTEIIGIARKTDKKLLKDVNLFDVFVSEDKLGAGKKSYAVSFDFENPEKTLSDKEVDKIMKKLIGSYEHQLGAVIRR